MNACIPLNFIYNNQSFSYFTFFSLVRRSRVTSITYFLIIIIIRTKLGAHCVYCDSRICLLRCDAVLCLPTHLYVSTEGKNHQIYSRYSLYLAIHEKSSQIKIMNLKSGNIWIAVFRCKKKGTRGKTSTDLMLF